MIDWSTAGVRTCSRRLGVVHVSPIKWGFHSIGKWEGQGGRFLLKILPLSCLGLFFLNPPPQNQIQKPEEKKGGVEEERMEILRFGFAAMAIFGIVLNLLAPSIDAQSLAPSPPPTSDGVTVDQGIACVLMLVALVLTYIIH
ncbi:hypothetical protein GQ457_12G022600 [Hibiscus cannabinus]